MNVNEWKPGCPEWMAQENGSKGAEEKRRLVLYQLITADHLRSPDADMVKEWHQTMFADIAPHDDYVGEFRDMETSPYCLQYYEVQVGTVQGVECRYVLEEVDAYFSKMQTRIAGLDELFPPGEDPPDQTRVTTVVRLAAWAHGEWVRIHPFANGNGRTARLLTNYVLVRYGFGPALALRPRPEGLYGRAAFFSMSWRDHRLMEEVIWRLLAQSYLMPQPTPSMPVIH